MQSTAIPLINSNSECDTYLREKFTWQPQQLFSCLISEFVSKLDLTDGSLLMQLETVQQVVGLKSFFSPFAK